MIHCLVVQSFPFTHFIWGGAAFVILLIILLIIVLRNKSRTDLDDVNEYHDESKSLKLTTFGLLGLICVALALLPMWFQTQYDFCGSKLEQGGAGTQQSSNIEIVGAYHYLSTPLDETENSLIDEKKNESYMFIGEIIIHRDNDLYSIKATRKARVSLLKTDNKEDVAKLDCVNVRWWVNHNRIFKNQMHVNQLNFLLETNSNQTEPGNEAFYLGEITKIDDNSEAVEITGDMYYLTRSKGKWTKATMKLEKSTAQNAKIRFMEKQFIQEWFREKRHKNVQFLLEDNCK